MGAANSLPEGQLMSTRCLMQEVDVMFGALQITDPQGDWACRGTQCVACRSGMIIRLHTLDQTLGHSHRLVWKTLQQQNSCQNARRLLVEMKSANAIGGGIPISND